MSLPKAMLQTWRANNANQDTLRTLQKHRLDALVRFAREKSLYYKRLYSDLDTICLEKLPMTNKLEMMSHLDEVFTDRRITIDRIDQFTSNLDNVGKMMDGKYLVFKTSGSTGFPATVLYDKMTIDVASAVAAFRTFARKEDYQAFMKHGKKTAGVFADYGFYLACGMSRYLQLRMPWKQTKITVDVNAPGEEIIRQLNAFQPSMLSGYPSNLALLADYPELLIKPDVIITGGELLTDEIRQKLTNRFGCYVQTHYSCTEGGEIACECSEGHLHINEDWVIVEPVDKDNNPVAPGVQSDKVLITNLSNYIQPFIRYELTDRIIIHDEPCACGKHSRWLEIEGRTDDIMTFASGVQIAPMSFYKILEEIKAIRRFQLVQTALDKLVLRLIADNPIEAFQVAHRELTSFLESKELTGVDIALSNELPQSDKISGKFKHVIALKH
ncbi:MAG: phenylacetate--CoA ligase family protein [Bacteroidales bacterium]|nr:phenylacetate--CoA ligase family protein [Bacteroidales bacterium]